MVCGDFQGGESRDGGGGEGRREVEGKNEEGVELTAPFPGSPDSSLAEQAPLAFVTTSLKPFRSSQL